MSNNESLDDWQLALLVEARRVDDPTVVEAAAAETYRDYRDLLDDAESLEVPVVVERETAQKIERAESLLEAAEGIDEPEVVESSHLEALQDDSDAIADLLAEPLQEQCGLRESVIEDMTVPQMVNQFRDDEDGTLELENLRQQPETGGAPDDDAPPDDPDDIEAVVDALDRDTKEDAKDKARRADLMANRTPEYAESLRQEVADIVGVDDFDDLEGVF